jgi:hypothetical protein
VVRSVDARVVRVVEFRGSETEQDVDFVQRQLPICPSYFTNALASRHCWESRVSLT